MITPTQMRIIEHTKTHGGTLLRWPGGLWQPPGAFNYLSTHFRTPQIDSCIKAGLLRVAGLDKFKRPTIVTLV